jgi:hypothetical protein
MESLNLEQSLKTGAILAWGGVKRDGDWPFALLEINMFKTVLIGAAALLTSTAANAVVVLSSNFDAVTSPLFATQGYAILPSADGWTGGQFGLEIQNNGVAGAPFSSPNLVELDTTANSSMFVALAAGTYKVSYYYSARPNFPASSNGIDLSIGNTLLDSVALTGGGDTAWQLRTVNFTTSGDLLTFTATGTSDGAGGYLDSITIETATVPEPASWAMLLAGFGLVGFAARRRRIAITA